MKSWNHRFGFLLIYSGLFWAFISIAFASEYVVVANKGVPYNSLSKAELKDLFLGDKTRWDDGKPVKIAVLDGGAASKAFLQSVVGKTPSQYELFWKKLVFTGKAAAPKSFDDATDLAQFVSGTSGAIGFVADGQAGNSVKTISIK